MLCWQSHLSFQHPLTSPAASADAASPETGVSRHLWTFAATPCGEVAPAVLERGDVQAATDVALLRLVRDELAVVLEQIEVLNALIDAHTTAFVDHLGPSGRHACGTRTFTRRPKCSGRYCLFRT